MESPEYSPIPHHADASSRPSLGFPLGTALLLIVIFSLSGIFSCCYHWEKFRSLRQSFSDNDNVDLEANHSPPSKPLPNPLVEKQVEMKSMPVIMPGYQMATFIAMPCPREPPHILLSSAPPPPLPNPPKPPRFPVPLY